MMNLDFGYPWWLSYGHLALAAGSGAGLALAYGRGVRSKWLLGGLGVMALWAGVVFLLVRFGVNIDSVAALPTENFMRSGEGKVLDIGAGTGRSSIMLLRARPKATLVALDLFGDSFDSHFGRGESPAEQRLMANLKAAGVEQRASIVKSDMRKLPFDDAVFDGIVSAYAVDHLGRSGSEQALAEAARVLKPGGEFLLMLVNGRDPWMRFAFGPLLAHGGFRGADWWEAKVAAAGLRVAERGTVPVTFYVVAVKERQR